MNHRALLAFALLGCAAACEPSDTPVAEESVEPPRANPASVNTLDLTSLTSVELADMLSRGEITALLVTRAHLQRISRIDDAGPMLNAIIEINPAALEIARELDARFLSEGPVGALHGLPVVLKANIDTGDAMATSAGSLALADHHAARDAFLVARLREAGAVILGKANLSEWANFRDNKSSSGWSSIGGQTKNPHVLDRNPCGSSSGSASAVAASLTPLAVGTETNGSIVCPAGVNGIVGIKPTLGTVSRQGIIPIAHSQDTAGPMARTVTGAAMLLEAMVGYDPADAGSVHYPGEAATLLPDPTLTSLEGKRIGVFRSYYGAGDFPRVEAIFERSITVLGQLGATVVDPITYQPNPDARDAQYTVLLYEFKTGLNAYLAGHLMPANVATLADLIHYNQQHADVVMPIFGQSIFIDAAAKGDLGEAGYTTSLAASNEQVQNDLEALLEDNQLDALFIPVNGPAWKTDWLSGDRYDFGGTASLAAISGYPSIVLPAGDVSGLPVAVGFVGRRFAEPGLIQLAYVFEQATRARLTPRFVVSLETPPTAADN